MKKNLSLITMNLSLVKWLKKQTEESVKEVPGALDFIEGLDDLINGKISNVLLEIDGESIEGEKVIIVEENIKLGQLEINPKTRVVLNEKKEISLTAKEFDILYFLAENRGIVFSKEQIYNAVWSEDYFLSDSNIMAFIRKLRKKIEPNPDEPVYIITIWGVGYKFNDKL